MHSPAPPTELVDAVASAQHVAVITGAGVSAESGIPTFRDALAGLWAKFDPTELATPEAFNRQPDVVSRWYDERRCAVLQCKPNPGHHALAKFAAFKQSQGRSFTLITQNVDQLHQRAGSTDVVELHGSLLRWRCRGCGVEAIEVGSAFATYPPICAKCGDLRRPGVVWFGEMLPTDALRGAAHAAESCDLFMSIGTSGLVEPAASIAVMAKNAGARVVEINPQATPLTPQADWYLAQPSGRVLPELLSRVIETGS